MLTLRAPEYKNLGYIWGPKNSQFESSWLQFADDAVIISNNSQNTQPLVNLFLAWTKWADMKIRLDKCQTFGMAKRKNCFTQIIPSIFIGRDAIPAIPIGDSFTYLGKIFNFTMKNEEAKEALSTKLKSLLNVTNNLEISAQTKLRILKEFITSQISFELKTYNFSKTWIEAELDSMANKHIRDWLKLPICACIEEFKSLPKHSCGLGIQSFTFIHSKLFLSKRFSLKNNINQEMQQIWQATHHKHIEIDSLMANRTLDESLKEHKLQGQHKSKSHVESLISQGIISNSIDGVISNKLIQEWSNATWALPECIFQFTRKSLLQLLPTAANLHRWKRSDNPSCSLCQRGIRQTNKHVLSNCSSPSALTRYTKRHDAILSIIVQWIQSQNPKNSTIHADIDDADLNPIVEVFQPNVRPDLVIVQNRQIFVLELTVCHETNLVNSFKYKTEKYKNLNQFLQPKFINFPVNYFPFEISVHGFMTNNLRTFLANIKLHEFPLNLRTKMIRSVIFSSFDIYKHRDIQ